MAQVTHQTVRLSSGKHISPNEGVCVMELASMLAGEKFTDYPRSVSNVIGTFLRGYNDIIDDRRRQDLYRYAAGVVGSSASRSVELARAQRLIAWGDQFRSGPLGRLRRLLGRPALRLDPGAARTVGGVRAARHKTAHRWDAPCRARASRRADRPGLAFEPGPSARRRTSCRHRAGWPAPKSRPTHRSPPSREGSPTTTGPAEPGCWSRSWPHQARGARTPIPQRPKRSASPSIR